jgi:FAD/FMN-containing dehydrogenase
MRPLSSWGHLSADPHEVIRLQDPATVAGQLSAHHPGIAHGMGRSYGDVCLNAGGIVWQTTGLDHYIQFDQDSGRLICEAGVLLRDIQRMSIPRGWILPVTPGTQLITVGGAIANDVHGKNHHVQGSFGDHVERIRLLRTDGQIIDCGPQQQAQWFAATVGGLGLTGVMVEAELQLCRVPGPWLENETIAYDSLEQFFQLADDSEAGWQHTVSWIDCLNGAGRGLFMRGNPVDGGARTEPKGKKRSMPLVPPCSLVNRWSLPPFNQSYYHLKKWRTGRVISHYESFFYPLDNLLHWNRMYGPRGFYQYQSVVPRAVGQDAVHAMLNEITRADQGSFLAVLKTFGARQPLGMLSFPQPGVTLALDFPNRGAATLQLFERLDAIVRQAGGRLYPAKDARMPRDLFEAGYPRLGEFLALRDPGISSEQSRRLMGY